MRTVKLRPAARADLENIWAYTVDMWSVDQASVYVSGLGAAFERLAQFPELSRLRTEFAPPVRVHQYEKHVIVYAEQDSNLEVIRILHSRSNWTDLLSE